MEISNENWNLNCDENEAYEECYICEYGRYLFWYTKTKGRSTEKLIKSNESNLNSHRNWQNVLKMKKTTKNEMIIGKSLTGDGKC